MGIIADAGAYLLNLFATVFAFIAERPWFIGLGCGLMCLALVAAGKLSRANDIIDNHVREDEEK